MSTPTSVQIVPGNLVLSGNVHTNDTDNTFCIDRANGIVGIGRGLTSLVTDVDDSNVLQISGEVTATKFHGDGTGITGLTDSKWVEDDNVVNNIHYSLGNVGIGGVASGTEALTVYGDLNLKSGGQLKFNGQTPVFSNWSVNGSDIYRSTGNVGIGGVASGTNKLKVHGTVEASSFIGIQDVNVPNLDASIITSGIFDTARTGTTSVTVLTLASTNTGQDTGIRIPNGGCGLLIVQKKRSSNTGYPYYSGNPVYKRDQPGISLYVVSGGTSEGTATDGSFCTFLKKIHNDNQVTPTMYIDQVNSSQSKIMCISHSPNRGCTVVVSYCPLIIP
jgi:hypothetical protein